jgi:signal peptidase II
MTQAELTPKTSFARALPWYALAMLVIGADQASKLAADALLQLYRPVPLVPFFNLTLAYNEGAAFSFLADSGGWQRWFFTVLALVVSAVLAVWLARLPREERGLGAALSLVLGGALGNLIDRLAYGHVIDFIDFYVGNWHWPAFNIADSAISVGAALLIFHSLFLDRGNDKA